MGKYENSPAPKKHGKKKLVLPLVLLILTTAILVAAVYLNTLPDQVQEPRPPAPDVSEPNPDGTDDLPPVEGEEPEGKNLLSGMYTFVLAGTNDNYNTDTLMVGKLDANDKSVDIISIPRDSMVDVPYKIKRINGAYGWGGVDGMLEQVASVSGIYAQYYCVVNLKGFIKIVDLVGGVDFDVPYDMYHLGLDESDTINLKKGMQTLDGSKALQLVRYRGTKENDFGRIQLQKDFLVAVLKTVIERFSLAQVGDLIEIASESVKTNMPVTDMIRFYNTVVSKMDLENDINFYTMPYTGFGKYKGQDYVYLDEAKALELINDTINPFDKPLTGSDLHIVNFKD